MKKIIGIVCASLGCILLSALLAFGIFTIIKNRNVAQTGNVLGVSWYNETDRTFTISTVEELYEFSELSKFYDFKGQTIKLGADIVVNEGNAAEWREKAPQKKWRPINKFAGTFDGQGHTISGLYAKTSGTALAMFTNTSQSCTIKNMKLVNTYFESRGLDGVASFASIGGGKFYQLYSDAIIECKGEKVAGIMSMVTKATKFEECWFDGEIHTTNRDAGGIVDDIYASRVEMKHCLFSGTLKQDYTIGGTRTGGICGKVRDGSSLIMNDCLVTGKLIAEKTIYSGSLVGVVYGGCQLATTDCYVSSNAYHLLIGESGDQGAFNGLPLQMPNDMLLGTKAYEWTTLNFDRYWVAMEDGTPVLKCFGEKGLSTAGLEKAFDTSWYIPGMSIHEITTLKQLYGLYILSGSNNFAENTIKLGADIVVNEGKAENWAKNAPKNPWFAINKFAGVFDGQGHTISGIYLKNQLTYQGFFGQVEPAGIVKNFNLKNSYFCNDSDKKLAMLGSIAGEFRGKLDNVYSNAIVECSGIQAGGIFGRTNDNDDDGKEDKVVITNCWFDGELRMRGQGGRYGGGFVGMVVQGDLDITHCLNTGRISAEAKNIGLHVGGFVGSTMNKGVINMDDCLSAGTMDVEYTVCVGSVFGRSEGETRTVNITNTYATQECFAVTFFGTSEGGATTATVNGGAIPLPEDMLTGYTAYQWTDLDFAKNWAVVKNGTPVLRNFAKSVPSIAGQKKMMSLKWYQAGKKSYTVKTANDLRGLALISSADNFKDKTVKLGANIDLGKNVWLTIGNINMPFQGTFDGQGHTISGVKFDTKEYYGGLFGVAYPGSTIKNFRLTDSEFTYSGEGSAILGSVVADLYGGATLTNVYSNATVVSCGSQVGGLVGRVNDNDEDKKKDKAVISNCWFDGTLTLTGEETIYGGGIAGRLFRGDLDMSHCLNTGALSTEATGRALQFGGLVGAVNEVGTFNLSDSLNVGKITATYDNGVGSAIGRVSCTEKDDRIVNIKNTYGSKESYKTTLGNYSATAQINGATVPLKESLLTGYKAHEWTTLDFAKNWAVVEDDTPVLQKFASKVPSVAGQSKKINLDWYKADATKYEIKTAEELRGLALIASGDTFKDKTITLKADIDLENQEWTPIGTESKNFLGTFDGAGHTISGVSLDTKEYYGGLFGVIGDGSVVKNFRLEDSQFTYSGTGSAILGSIVGDLMGGATLENVYSNAKVVSCGSQVGGMIGRVNDNDTEGKEDKVVVSNCWFDGTLTMTGEETIYGGGITGRLFRGDLDMSHCLNTGALSSEAKNRATQFGGLIGAVNDYGTLNLTDSLSVGTISAQYETGTGSVIGRVSCDDATVRTINIEDTYVTDNSYKVAVGTSTAYTSKGAVLAMPETTLTGYKAYQWTELDFEDSWAVVKEDIPVPQVFAKEVPSLSGYDKLYDLDWYDADKTKFELKTEEEFRGLALLSLTNNFKGKTITLKKDMELEDEAWLPIGPSGMAFAGTFDGQMHTIKGINVNANSQYAGMFGQIDASGVVKNFYLTDSTIKSTSYDVGSVAGVSYGIVDTVYSNATIIAEKSRVGGIVGHVPWHNTTTYIKNCWFDGAIDLKNSANQAGGILGYVANEWTAGVSVTNCVYTGSIDFEATSANWGLRIGGIVGGSRDYYTPTITIENCVSAGTITQKSGSTSTPAVAAVYGGFDELRATTLNLNKVYATNECFTPARIYHQYKASGSAANATLTINGTGTLLDEAALKGASGYHNTNLDFDNTWVARANQVPGLKVFTKVVTDSINVSNIVKPDTSWYNADVKVQEIQDEADMYGFLNLLSEGNTFAEKEIHLKADLTMNYLEEGTVAQWKAGTVVPENQWAAGTKFAGTFDGEMHTIKGLYLNTSSRYAGLFGQIQTSGVVKNFYLTDSLIQSTSSDVGSVAGVSYGTVDTVYSNATIIAQAYRNGGIVGHVPWHNTTAYIKNCWFDGEMDLRNNACQAGGILGYVADEWTAGVSITNCLYTGSIAFEATSADWGLRIGGIVGGSRDYYTPTIAIENCMSAGAITHKTGSTATPAVSTVYGGFDELRATTLNLTNVYGINECFAEARIYHAYKASGSTAEATLNINGKGIMKARADFLGTAGYQNTLLDFEDTWVARKDNVPGLKAFTKVIGETVDIANVEQDNWYDASETVFGIGSASALKSLATYTDATNKISFQDKKIYLLDDIEINKVEEGTLAAWKAETGTLPASWQPIGVGAAFNGTFDGGMHTISGVYMKKTDNTNKSEWTGLGLFAATGYYSTVKNFSLVDSYFELKDLNGNNNNAGYIANLGSIAGYHHGYMNNVYSNATIVSNRRMVGGIMGYSQSRGVTNVWYDGDMTLLSNHGREAGGIIGIMNSANTFENILFTGKITFDATVDYAGIGGLFGITETSSTVSPLFKNVVIAGELAKSQYANDLAKGSVVGLLFKSTVRVENLYVTNETWGTTHNTYGSNVGKIDGSITTVAEADLYGTFGYQNTNLDFENVWAARKNDVPGLKAFVDESISVGGVIRPDTSWYDKEATTLEIQDEADMYGFMQLMLKGETFANKIVTLTADLEMNAVDDNSVKNWQAGTKVPACKWIASNSKKYAIFEGTFDGGNHTISGLYCVDNGTRTGLFGQVSTVGSVKNVRITDSYFNHANTSGYVGSVAAELYGPMENVYSDAVVDSKAPYTGGLVAVMSGPKYSLGETVVEDEVEYALYSRHTRIVKNCWFDGEVNAEITTADSRVGGFVALVSQGKINFENSLFTGNISVKDVLDSTRIGGFVGSRTDQSVKDSTNKYIYVDESTGEQTPAYTTVNVNSCIAAGEIVVTGSTEARVGAVTGYATHGKFADTFATKGTYPVPHKNSNTYEGDVIQTHNTDRLIGYCVDEKYGSKLDYENDWSMRVSGVPIPKVFENIVGADKIENNPAALSEEIGLDTWGGTLANAVDYGVGNYVVSYSSDFSKYAAYLTMLKNNLGFTKYTDNSESNMDEDGVYNAVYTKAAGDWVLDITFVQREGKIYISISTIGESGLSPNLKASDANIALANTVGNVSFSMLELTSEYGAGFVFELPNGHFIINDGGQKVDAPNLVAYLKEQADTDKIIIDAWILTHPHNDHSGVLYKFFEDASLREDIYVNGVYLSEPNLAVKTIDPTDNDTREVENIFRGLMVMTQEDGVSKPAVYRMHMGERYYFCGLTVDVIQTQEQIPTSEYKDYNDPDYLNTMSTNCVYTLKSSGKKILLGGDSTNKNMQYIMEAYGKNYTEYNHDKKKYGGTSVTLSNINVFATYHHGKNTTADYSEVTGEEVIRDKWDGGYDRHIDATKEYADYLLYNTNNAEGFKFDTILFPYHQVYDMQKSDKVYTYYPGGMATELKLYVGDDGSHVFPWNIGDINQYFIDHAKSYYTYGYEDYVNGVKTTKDTRHGTVQFIFNTDSIETIIHDTNIVPTE